MFSISTGILPQLERAFAAGGDDDLIGKLIQSKLENIGKGVLSNFIPGNPLQRISEAIDTGGMSEFNRMRSQWLSSVTPAPLPGQGLYNNIVNSFEQNKHLLSRPTGKWQRWDRSRQQWLDEHYRHDWRTQRRDPHGRWVVGRTRFPYVPKKQRRQRSIRRRMARKMARQIMQEMNRRGS